MRRRILGLGLVVLLGSTTASAGGAITGGFVDVPLGDLAKLVEQVHGITIRAPAYVARREVTVKAEGLSAVDFVKLVAEQAGATIESHDSKTFTLVDDWRGRVERGLQKAAGFKLEEASLAKALAAVEAATGVPVVLDAGSPDILGETVAQLQVESIQGSDMLTLICSFTDTAWQSRWGVVFVTPRPRLTDLPADAITPAADPEAPEAAQATRRRILDGVLAKSLEGGSAAEAITALGAATGLKLLVTEAAREKAAKAGPVRLPASLSLEHALTLLLAPAGLAYEIGPEGEIRVIPAKK